jgi:hypothetical protein
VRSKSERHKQEWDFFINPKTDRIQYNEKCLSCAHEECKQSFRARIVFCGTYMKKQQP